MLNKAHLRTQIALITALFGLFGVWFVHPQTALAAAGTNKTINYQGRLLNAAGAVVPDGAYNMQFKIYQDGPGNVAGDTGGTLMWTENWVYGVNSPDNRVIVKNGYYSVNLGSICHVDATTCTASTGNSQTNSVIDFNQDTLWLSMNVGNTSTAATFAGASGDGEMLPMKRMTSAIYSLQAANADLLGGLSSAGFIQNVSPATTQQTANINILSGAATTVAAAKIQAVASATAPVLLLKGGATPGTGADLLQLQDSSAAVLSGFNSSGQLFNQSGSYTGTISQNSLGQNTVYNLPDPGASSATICLSSGNCSVTGGSGYYIQNGTGLQTGANFNIESANASDVVGTLKGATSQTADLLQLQNDNGTVAKFDANGTLVLGVGDGSSGGAGNIRGAAATGSNVAGSNLTIDAGNGTGTGGSGSVVIRTAQPAAGGGPTVGTYTTTSNSNANTLSESHTVTSGLNRVLIVQVVFQSNGASVTSMTYGGVSMTSLGAIGNTSNSDRVEAWYLINPTVGTATVAANFSAYRAVQITAINMTGVNQTTPFGTVVTNQGGSTTASATVSGSTTDTVLDFVTNDTGSSSHGAGQTTIWSGTQGVFGASSYKAGSSSVTMSWTLGSNMNWAIIAVPVQSAAGTGSADTYTEGLRVNNLGRVGINSPTPGAQLQVTTNAANVIGQIIQGYAGQTYDLLQLQDSSGNVNAAFNSTGNQLTLGRIASSGTVTAGSLLFGDGTTDNFGATLNTTTLTASRTITLPDSAGTLCLSSGNCSGAGAGYIVNGTSTQTGNFNIQSAAVGSVGAVIEGASGQTADILQVKVGAGGNALRVDSIGTTFTGALNVSYGEYLNPGIASGVGLAINGFASQTADLLRLQNSSGNVLTSFDANGQLSSYGTNTNLKGLATPVITSPTTTGTTAYYVLTATNAQGETVASNVLALNSSSATVNWTQVPGATGYKLYRNTSNSFASGSLLRTTIANGSTVTFTDNGAATGAGLPPTALTGTGLTVQGWSGQSASAFQIKDATGTVNTSISSGGTLANLGPASIGTGNQYNSARLSVGIANSTNPGIVIRGAASQSADLLQLQNSSAAVLSGFNSSGELYVNSGSYAGTLAVASLTANRTYTLPDATGTICIVGAASCSATSTGAIANGTTTQTGNFNIQSAASGSIGAVIQGASGQSVDLLRFKDSGGTTLAEFQNDGTLLVPEVLVGGTYASAALSVQGWSTTITSEGIRAVSSQTADLLQFQNSSGNPLSAFNANGDLIVGGTYSGASTTALQVNNTSGSPLLSVDTSNNLTKLQGTNSDATIGSELLSSSTCSGTNWAGSGTGPYTHTTGSTASLVCTPPASVTAGAKYQLVYTTSSVNNGTVTGNVGGQAGRTINTSVTNETELIIASGTGSPSFTPTSTFDGAVTIVSIKQVTSSNAALAIQNTSSTTTLEVRGSGSTSNAFIGLQAGQNNSSSGTQNNALGAGALQNNTTGGQNDALGYQALQLNVVGNNNNAIGYQALQNNTNGNFNTAIGSQALQNNINGSDNVAISGYTLQNNTTGSRNTAIGYQTLQNNTTGSANIAFGEQALQNNTVGSNNVGIGTLALLNTTGSASNNTAIGVQALQSNVSGSNNTAIGFTAGYQDPNVSSFVTMNNLTNSTTIGYGSQVQASNSLILGGQGSNAVNVGIGTTIPLNTFSVSPLDYNTGTAFQSGTTVTGVGTTWTSAMIGEQFIFSSGQTGTITAVGSTTSLTLSVSQSVSTTPGVAYRIQHIGFQVKSDGTAYLQATSATAFQVQNASGTSALTVDSTTNTTTTGDLKVGTLPTHLFSDGFETGDFSAWSSTTGASATIDSSLKHNGSYSVNFTNSSSSASLSKTHTSTATLDTNGYLYIASYSTGADIVPWQNVDSGSNAIAFSINSTGKLCYSIDVTSAYACNSVLPVVSLSTWHHLETYVTKATSGGIVQVWLDGVQYFNLSTNTGALLLNQFEVGQHFFPETDNFNVDDISIDPSMGTTSADLTVSNAATVYGATTLENGATVYGDTNLYGNALVKPSANSTIAFQVQNASGVQLLSADTTNLKLDVNGNLSTPTGGLGTSQNLLQYSEDLDQSSNWPVSNISVTANNAVAPNGLTTAETLTASSTTNKIGQTVTVTASTTYTMSWWVKLGTLTGPKYAVYDNTHSANIVAPTAYSGATSTGWTRVSQSFTTPAGTTSISVYPENNSTASGTLYIWGVQLEQGGTAGTYVHTGNTTISTANVGSTVNGSQLISNSDGGAVGLTIQGSWWQTADLLQVKDDYGSSLFSVDSSGNATAHGTVSGAGGGFYQWNDYQSSLIAQNTGSNTHGVTAVIKRVTGQSADLLELQDSSANALTSFSPNGDLQIGSAYSTNSATAFVAQNSSGIAAVKVDTLNDVVTTNDLNVGSAANTTSAGRLFSDNFEEGVSGGSNFPFWNTVTGTVTYDSIQKRDGQLSAKMTGSGNGLTTSVKSSGTIDLRAYVYVPNNTTSTNPGILTLDSSGGSYAGLYRNSTSNHLILYWNNGSNTNDSGVTLPTGSWNELEVKVVGGTGTSGSITAWLNGTQIGTSTGINTTVTTFNSIDVGDPSGTQTVQYDDVSADSVRPGDSASLNVLDSFHVSGTSSFGNSVVINSTSGQTADLQQWLDSSGSLLARIKSNGDWSMHGYVSELNGEYLNTGYSGGIGLELQGVSGQSANLLTIEDNSSNPLFTVNGSGLTQVTNPQGATSAPTRSSDGQFAFAKVGGFGRIYFRISGTNYYINDTATGDYSEYFLKSDSAQTYTTGLITTLDSSGKVRPGITGEVPMGIVSAFGTRNNDDVGDGRRNEDPHYVNVGIIGQLPVIVTSEAGPINGGEAITLGSKFAGAGVRATHNGQAISRAIQAFNPNDAICQPASSFASIPWPADQNEANPANLCFKLPDGTYVGKIMAYASAFAYDSATESPIQGSSGTFNQLAISGAATIGALSTDSLNVSGATTLDSLTVNANAAISGTLTVTGLASFVNIEISGHLITGGDVPVAEVMPAAGQNAQVAVTGNDTSGTITITTGDPYKAATANSPATLAPTAGELTKLSFAKAYAKTPRVIITPGDAISAGMQVYPGQRASDHFDVGITATPLPHTTYTFEYFVTQ